MSRRILVVDDEENLRSLLRAVLEDRGYDVVEADGGDTALSLLEGGEDFDAVLLDVCMPRTSGWETLRVMKDADGWPLTKVIMLTCNHEPEAVLKSWCLGADNYLTKPYEIDTLTEVLENALVSTH